MEEYYNNINNSSGISGNDYNDELIKSQNNKIKKLKRKIKAYENNAESQNLKLADYDHLLVEYKGLIQNYNLLEQELKMIKNENKNLKGIIKNKNNEIKDFQVLFQSSKSKFDLFNQTNNSLQMKIVELESKLKMNPNISKQNEELKNKI